MHTYIYPDTHIYTCKYKKKHFDCVFSIFNISLATVTKCLLMGDMLGLCKLIKEYGQDLLEFQSVMKLPCCELALYK